MKTVTLQGEGDSLEQGGVEGRVGVACLCTGADTGCNSAQGLRQRSERTRLEKGPERL